MRYFVSAVMALIGALLMFSCKHGSGDYTPPAE